MPKYIDADWILFELGIGDRESREDNVGEIITAEDVDNWPAADVEPVRHGKWEKPVHFKDSYYHCSACGASTRCRSYCRMAADSG